MGRSDEICTSDVDAELVISSLLLQSPYCTPSSSIPEGLPSLSNELGKGICELQQERENHQYWCLSQTGASTTGSNPRIRSYKPKHYERSYFWIRTILKLEQTQSHKTQKYIVHSHPVLTTPHMLSSKNYFWLKSVL